MEISRRSVFALGGAAMAAPSLSMAASGDTGTPFVLGVASYSLREFSRSLAIKSVKQIGTPYINIKEFHLPYVSTPAELAKGKNDFEKAGLKILGGGTISFQKKSRRPNFAS